MNKFLTSALLGLASLGLALPTASAGTFGLFPHCGFCCRKCCTFCVRPYNAFSPVCSGNICLDGIYPFASGYPGAGGQYLNYNGVPCCSAPVDCDGTCMDQQPDGTPTPIQAGASVFANQYPVQAPAGPAMGSPTWQGYPQPPVQPTGYNPGYYPGYNYGYPPVAPAGAVYYYGGQGMRGY